MSDNVVYKIEYSKTGRSKCKNSKCKGEIEKGEMRIGKQFPSDRFTDGGTAMDWYHAKCIFETQKRARKTTKKIDNVDDLEGYDDIKDPDKKVITKLFKEQREYLQKKPASKKKSKPTPTKKPASSSTWVVDDDEDENNNNNKSISSEKKNKLNTSDNEDNDDLLQFKFTKSTGNKEIKDKTTTTTTTSSTSTPNKKKKVLLKSILSPKWFDLLESSIISKSNYDSFINGGIKTLPKKSGDIFLALNLIAEPRDCKVVIIGQAPYRNKDSASGLAYCDDDSKHWQLSTCKVATKNIIKQAMIAKGCASKDDDVNTLREILGEVDLPGDSPKDWFKSVAKQGVMWLNTSLTCTEDQENIDEHTQFWGSIIEEIIRSIFNVYLEDATSSQSVSQNPIPGVVFVLFGKGLSTLKNNIETINSEFMGAVPMEIIEGQSPILESFNSYDYFNQINKALKKLNQPEIDWWKPKLDKSDESGDEDEIEDDKDVDVDNDINTNDNNNNNNNNNNNINNNNNGSQNTSSITTTTTNTNKVKSTPKKSNNFNPDDYECYLIREDSLKFQIEPGNEITIGRKNLDIQDLAISRRHANVKFINTKQSHYLELTPTGTHPMHLCLSGDNTEILQNHVPVEVHNGQQLYLCNKKYQFTVEIVNKNNPNEIVPSQSTSSINKNNNNNKNDDDNNNNNNNNSSGSDKVKPSKRKLDDEDNNSESTTASQKPKLTNSSQTPTNKKPTPKPSSKPKPAKKAPKKKSAPLDRDMDDDDDFIVDDSDDDDYHSDGGDDDDDPFVNIPTRQHDKPDCKYWDLCYRKNPQHLAEFRHPDEH